MPNQIVNFEQLVQNKSKSISAICNLEEHGNLKARAILSYLITDVITYFNVSKTIDEEQLKDILELIIHNTEFNSLTPESFALCFNRAKTGKYGMVNEKLDGQIIFSWLRKFSSEVTLEYEQYRAKENAKYKEEWNMNGASQEYLDLLENIVSKIEKRKSEQAKPKVTESVKMITTADELYATYSNEFNSLFAKDGISTNGIMFIKINENLLDRETFIKFRFDEWSEKVRFYSQQFFDLYNLNGFVISNTMYIEQDGSNYNLEEYVNFNLEKNVI